MEGYSSNHFLLALYLLLAFTTYINSSSAASTEFIKTSCRATTYPTLCFSSLSSRASAIQNSPKRLAHEALSVALDSARSTSTLMRRLSHTRGMKPRENGAMKDCVEELSDSVDELMDSLGEMSQPKGKSFEFMISDVQTWVSAALTDEDTCSEGFAGNAMNGKIKNIVRGRIVNVAHLTSNALALINSYAGSP
ncbi:hypothetical protein RJ640_022858 [Escallonia rubra]|uniref:Pectinesterase inhibitor domain-containing protein n=1 Tax=Escallonia rubra TaxID=112253 RepID=A0AA88UBE3_9ASTE|nr:hypothetical protein RJ640_022858 [Escallonia rubra]